MSFFDLMAMSLGNLWRRKLRTFLTVLGVMIGTASIVAMLSLAIGMREMLMTEYEGMGSATQITVSSSGEVYEGGGGQLNMDTMLSDTNMEMFQGMEHVESVSPMLTFDVEMRQGKYQGWVTVAGVDSSILQEQELGKGALPEGGGSKLQVLAGNGILASLYYSKGEEIIDYYSTGELPNVDLMRDVRSVYYTNYDTEEPAEVESDGMEEEAGETGDGTEGADELASENTGMETENTTPLQVQVTGVMAGDVDTWTEYSNMFLTDIEGLKRYMTKTFGKGKIPGQPKPNGKPLTDWVYNSFIVNVDDTENVEDLVEDIRDMGFEANSNKELLESMQSTMKIVEMVLGGIGMVAFVVAAIGIANTMMMSTYERTKEIGVMKVLGCDMRDIRRLFLSEAGFIGLIGGTVGLGITCLISNAINTAVAASEEMGATGQLSVITWWLALVAVVFSTMMGMLAGFFPARRAMKLSPLAAIRTE